MNVFSVDSNFYQRIFFWKNLAQQTSLPDHSKGQVIMSKVNNGLDTWKEAWTDFAHQMPVDFYPSDLNGTINTHLRKGTYYKSWLLYHPYKNEAKPRDFPFTPIFPSMIRTLEKMKIFFVRKTVVKFHGSFGSRNGARCILILNECYAWYTAKSGDLQNTTTTNVR